VYCTIWPIPRIQRIAAQFKFSSISLPARHSSVAFQPTKRPNIPIRQVMLIGKSSLGTDYVLFVTLHARSRRPPSGFVLLASHLLNDWQRARMYESKVRGDCADIQVCSTDYKCNGTLEAGGWMGGCLIVRPTAYKYQRRADASSIGPPTASVSWPHLSLVSSYRLTHLGSINPTSCPPNPSPSFSAQAPM